MTATCVTVRDPFHPADSREIRQVLAGGTLRDLAPAIESPFILLHNGAAVLRADWDRPVADADLVAIVLLPQGGGDGGSNPLQMVLMLAVMIYAPQLGMVAYEGMVGAAAITSAGATIAGMAGSMAGMAMVNALVPPPAPPSTLQAAKLASPSPTYNLQAQGNMARIDQAIPVQYGRLNFFPDLAAQPYVEYAGNEQYLYMLLCLGQGEYDVEAVRIEDTAVANFAEIDYEVIPPGGDITQFPANVVTAGEVSGQALLGTVAATYTRSGTTITVTLAAHGYIVGRKLYLDFTSGAATDGDYTVATVATDTFTVVSAASGTTSGNVTIQHLLGGYTATGPDLAANYLGLDFVLPRGLYHVDSGTGDLEDVSLTVVVEAREMDNLGAPIGSWFNLGTYTYTARTTTPQRYSERNNVPAGRYEVRARRTDVKQTDSAYGHELLWGGLRAYLPETRDYGAVTLLAMRMKASNNLSSQSSRKVNVIATRKLPVWNGTTWSAPVATSSIAWALADICRNTVYGAKLADSRIDLAGLLALDAIWAARGDEFNARFDAALAFWEALSKVAAAGRAKPHMQGGIIRIARDGAQTLPVAMFSMRNIVKGSFSLDYILPSDDTADAVEVAYFDRNYWAPRRVQASLPASAATKAAKIDLFGVTDRDHAHREGVYQAASNQYRRRIAKFSTEMEGFIPAYGDLISVQHDMPAWGQFAEVVGWDAATRTLTLSEPLTWSTGTHYLGLRTKAGGVDGPYAVTAGLTAYMAVLAADPVYTPYTGSDYERTQVVFGWAETWSQLAKVIAVRPRGLYQVEIEAINEDPSVHTADTGVTAPPVQTSQLTTLYTRPSVAGLTLRSSPSDAEKALLVWTAAPGAEQYQIEMASGTSPYDASLAWTRVGETSANNYAVTVLYGNKTLIRVRAIGLTVGPWVSLYYGSSADYMWTNDAALMWNAVTSTNMWSY